jgi:hypothetical protein
MATMSATAAAVARTDRMERERAERVFYLIAALVMMAAVAIGFRHFYTHGQNQEGGPITQQIVPLVILHGVLMSAWIVLFIVQSALIVRGNFKLHMTLGVSGVVLAGLIVALGTATGILSIHFAPIAAFGPWGPRRFLHVPLTSLYGFAVLVGIGLINRKKAAIHRPMMLLGTLSAVGAGIARIPQITGPLAGLSHASIYWMFWFPIIATGAILFVLKLAMTRRWDRYYAMGWVLLTAMLSAGNAISYTAWWQHLASYVR